jgi:hypothetical protein
MPFTANPEVISPRRSRRSDSARSHQSRGNSFDDAHLDLLAHLLDDFIRIPGTPVRFGLDGIIGFFPGVGDILGGLASTIIIFAAWHRGVSKITLVRMVMNVAIETGVGSLPILGNLFDIGWRANRRNYALLAAESATPAQQKRSSWLFVAGICLVLAVLMVIPIFLFAWILIHAKVWLHAGLGR